ncbi:hypothetical protein FGB62_19g120 [Gracilaria domingensis]|nr:hypothetical protein FGB62_19g120 [Gracilaria domingensis]
MGFVQQPLPNCRTGKRRATAIQKMLKSKVKSNRRALVTRHIYISGKDVKLIRSKCDDFLYITSTAPIKERLWSGTKHLLANRHGNTTRDSLDMVKALEVLRNQRFENGSLRSLEELNAYPYLTETGERAEVGRKLIPDYVIRKESLRQDLQALLRAFGCKESFSTRNVHEDNILSLDELFSDLPFSDDDQLYKYLSKVAKMNNVGALGMVKAFLLGDR